MDSRAGGWMDDGEVVREQRSSWFFQIINDWFTFRKKVFDLETEFLVNYGWRCLGGLIISVFLWNWLQPKLEAWRRAREDAAYHKDPDRVLAREEAVRRAREAQARRLQAESARQVELQKEKEEKKRREAAALLEKYGYVSTGRRLGDGNDDGFLPLSGGASTSTYRAPKRSACSGGGCGR